MISNLQQLMVICLVAELLIAIPAGMVLKRIGFSMWWALLCFIPILGVIGLWLVAFVGWPKENATQA